MRAYKCAKCGAGELQPVGDGRKAICQYCYSVMVLPTLDPEAFNRATELRQNLQFDQAEMAFERIIEESPEDSESYWNMVLCRYGIEYVTDRDGSLVPTCHRMSYRSIQEDPDYQKALQYADGYSFGRYQEEAARIDRVLKRAAQISQSQPAYDVFISYKETDESGYRTPDSGIAQNIYDAIKDKHPDLNVFLSRITLNQLAAGMEYEPVIFSALNSAKVMVVVGTSRANIESTWVRNEWGRFRRMMERDNSKKMTVVYRGMDPTRDFPPELGTFSIQATEAEGFYMQDFLRGLENLLGLRERRQAAAAQASSQVYSSANALQVENLLKRAEQELDHPDTARKFYQRALDIKADCAEAWWGLLLLDTHNLEDINPDEPFHLQDEADRAWRMVCQYADKDKRRIYDDKMRGYETHWTNEYNRKEAARLLDQMKGRTSDGRDFDEYSKYGPDGEVTRRLFEIVNGKQEEELNAFLDKYERNHEKFLDLQEWKASRPIDRAMRDPEYQELERQYARLKKQEGKSLKSQNGFFFGDVVFAIIALVCVLFCTELFPLWTDESWEVKQHLAPLMVSLVFFTVIIKLVKYSKPRSIPLTSADLSGALMTAMLPTIPAYFIYQYVIYIKARVYIPDLTWTCILVGIVYLMVIAIFVGVIGLIAAGTWIGALVYGVIVYVLANALTTWLAIEPIPGEILQTVSAGINLWLLIPAIAALIICVIRTMSNKGALSSYNKTTAGKKELDQAMEQYKQDQIQPKIQYYSKYVDSRYLKDVQQVDEEG